MWGDKMNIAFFLKPKASVAFLYSDYTIRQAIEKMRYYGYTAIPVIDRDGKYVGVVSEGDFLWYLTDLFSENADVGMKTLEETPMSVVMNKNAYQRAGITADINELVNLSLRQNFVPVTDDSESFIGIVTRRDIISHLADNGK